MLNKVIFHWSESALITMNRGSLLKKFVPYFWQFTVVNIVRDFCQWELVNIIESIFFHFCAKELYDIYICSKSLSATYCFVILTDNGSRTDLLTALHETTQYCK